MSIISKITEVVIDDMDGYVVEAGDRRIKVLICNQQSCCEHWGYFHNPHNLSEFIGAELLAVNLVNNVLEVSSLEELNIREDSCIFVNIETNRGTLQLTVYNEHNGYYSHRVQVSSEYLSGEYEELADNYI